MEMPSQRLYVAKITSAWYVLLVWFFLVLGASVSGWFHVPRGHPPVLLGLAVWVPVLLGLLDLVDGIVLGTAIQVGWLPTAIDTSAMSLFGMSLITVYLVPISLLLHFIGLNQLRKV
jgi:hypothetical protein